MERAGIIDLVKIKMDEFTPEGVSLPFDDFIGPLLDESALELLGKAPLYLLTPTQIPLTENTPPSSIVVYADDKAYIPVPEDYVRLYEIKYPLWKRAIRKAITPEDPEYGKQDNEYLIAGYGRPVVAVVYKTNNQDVAIRYFECGKVIDPGQTVLTPTALYIQTCKPEELNDILVDSLSWLCTTKVLGVLGQPDKARMALDQFSQSLTTLLLR